MPSARAALYEQMQAALVASVEVAAARRVDGIRRAT
jgi:hypothetical protein